jgi:hypothetical protein
MGVVTCQISISLDGFVAGPNQGIETPPVKVIASPAVTSPDSSRPVRQRMEGPAGP